MSDHELLQQIAAFLNRGVFVEGDKDSIIDMVQRYKDPPLTRVFPVCMRLTRAEYRQLTALMQTINTQLSKEHVA